MESGRAYTDGAGGDGRIHADAKRVGVGVASCVLEWDDGSPIVSKFGFAGAGVLCRQTVPRAEVGAAATALNFNIDMDYASFALSPRAS